MSVTSQQPNQPLRLWYRQPAIQWDEGMPIGNGRLGAMVSGGVASEHLQLNEATLVSGYPGYRDLKLDVAGGLQAVTGMIARREFAEADEFITRHWLGACWACYQPLGDLHIDFAHPGSVEDYRRELDLRDGIVRIIYRSGGVNFRREIFANHPDGVIVIRLQADDPQALKFQVRLGSIHPTAVVDGLALSGQLPGFVLRRTLEWVEEKGDTWKYPDLWDQDGNRKESAAQVLYNGRGLHFAAKVEVRHPSAGEAVLVLSAASNFGGGDPAAKVSSTLDAARNKTFVQLLENHTRDYQSLFQRVTLDLGESPLVVPTDERLKNPDPALAALYFQFGRYLLIAGSRHGGQPLNLQGIWNNEIIPAWACQYTLNINAQMNYWLAESGNLAECAEPLLRMTRELAKDGSKVAREMYQARGWVAHHNTTLWREAQPVDHTAGTSFWPMGGAWLCQNLMEHYEHSLDRDYLASHAYPLLKGACEFYLDWLVTDANGHLVTPVGTSPENAFLTESGKTASVSQGPTMDIAILRELFSDTLRAAEILNADSDFQKALEEATSRLRPYQIGSDGHILEWAEDFKEAEPDHRHISHLFGLYPGHQITHRTADHAAAARRTLERRGHDGTGWSMAWKINFWARLHDGEQAHKMLQALLLKNTLPSLLDNCPPFQIDGNLGGAAGIVEMLVQSTRDAEIELFPALPSAWPSGKATGLRARGGVTVDLEWDGGKLTRVCLRSIQAQTLTVRYAESAMTRQCAANEPLEITGDQFQA
jgi:alpha-L-fucosidase 2